MLRFVPVGCFCFLVCMSDTVPGEEVGFPRFVNVSAEAGLGFHHVNGSSGRYYPPEVNGGGLAAFDYDNDGWVDLYVVNGAALPGYTAGDDAPVNHLYRNLGDGRFADVTAEAGVGDAGYGMGCAAGDYDNDGDLDLYVSNYGPNALYRNVGDGTFVDVTAEAGVGDAGWGGGCAFADYDNDGDLDLYAANYVAYTLGEGGAGRIPYVSGLLRQKAMGDSELYASPLNYPAAPNRLYRNAGDGTFEEVARELGVDDPDGRGMGVGFCDYDGDGDPDLFVTDDQGGNSLFRNDGPWPGGRFTDVGLEAGVAYDGKGNAQATMGAAFGDYDNDGRFDLATTAFRGEAFAIYHNGNSGLFTDVAFPSRTGRPTLPPLGWGVFFFDYDNDGFLDLFMANGHVQDGIERVDPEAETAQRNLLFRNGGDGRFADVSAASGPGLMLRRQSRGAVCFDYDNDGDLDIAVLNRYCRIPKGVEDGVDLLRNDGGNRKHWVMVKLVGGARGGNFGLRNANFGLKHPDSAIRIPHSAMGSEGLGGGVSNQFGVGARVTVWTGGRRQVREVRCGSGYQSQNGLRAHVGLGAFERIDSLEVRWPGGLRQVLRDLAADRVLTVVEGDGGAY